jgi:hypothetical protein
VSSEYPDTASSIDTEPGAEFDPSRPTNSFIEVVKGVLVSPTNFFSSIATDDKAREERLGPPVLFIMAVTLVFAILGGLYEVAEALVGGTLSEITAFGLSGWSAVAALTPFVVIGYPLGSAVGIFIGAFFLHLLVMVVAGGGRRSYYSTLKLTAYLGATSLFAWIPVVWLAATIYQGYLTFAGARELHRTTVGRAGVIAAVSLAFSLVLFVAGWPGPLQALLAGGLG